MKAVLLSLLLLVGLSQVLGQTVTPVSFNIQYNSTVDNCVTQYWSVAASALSAQSYLFFTVIDGDTDTSHGVLFYVGAGFQPSSSNYTQRCDTVSYNQGQACYIRIDCAFQPITYYITTTISWGGNTPSNVSSAFNFTVVQGGVSVTDLGTIQPTGLPATSRATQNYTLPGTPSPYPPKWEHYKVTVSPLPNSVYQGSDLVLNLTNIQFFADSGSPPPFEAYISRGQYNDENADCTRQACTQTGTLPGLACSWRFGYCDLVANTYYIAVLRGNLDGHSYFNFSVSAYWDTKPVTTLTLNTAKYDQISDWAMEKYYTFTTTGPADEVTVNVYDVAGGNVTWWASQNYVVATGSTGTNCKQLIGCTTPYTDACRDQYHYCPTPASGVATTWFVTVRATSRIDGLRNRDFISYVVMATAKSRTNTPLSSPQFAVTGNVQGAVYQEDYDYYSFSLPSAIVNETFYIELYVDSTQDEALLSRNYLMDGTTFAGPTLKNSNSRCQDYDWQCRTNQSGTTHNQRCYLQIPTCKLIPGTTLYFSVYGIKSQFYGIPISYTLFGGLQTPMQLQDGISYQDQTNQQSYVHYLYRYSATDKTPGDALMIEVTNIKASTTTNVYVNFKGALAGDCPCYKYDYMCQDSQECLFDTYSLFGGAGCQALQTGDIYISVLGVNDTGLPNIGYTITITKYNWAGPVNTLVAGNLVYGYVSDSEYVFYWLDTSTITTASPLVEMEVRFVEYIKNGNNDNEQLTLYTMRDNLLTPTCAPYTCTTPRYVDPSGYSYCKVVLQPCQFDKSKDWYLVVKGTGGTNKGRSIHYTIRAKPVAVTPMALTNGVPMPGSVDDIGQIDHYSYTVSSTTNKRLYIEMYVDKDFARQVEFKVNYGYLASGSMCYNYTGSCSVITGYDVKCVYHIPNCQLQAGTYYFGVHALNDFYNGPAPYTIAVYEKTEILAIGDATDPAFGPVFTKLQRNEYQVFQFDASQLKQGDIWYFEIDQVERGNLTVVASSGKPAGLCPCYGPVGKNVINDVKYNVTSYWLFSQSCTSNNVYYFYVQPLITDGYWNESHVAFSATIYVNKPTTAVALTAGQANNVTSTTTQYTHRYYMIAQSAAYAQSDIIVRFRSLNSTLTTLFGKAGGYTNQYCGATAPGLCNTATCDLLLQPCAHRLDLGSYYFDATAFTNDSYAYQLWYDRVDVTPVAINTNVTGNVSADALVNTFHLLTPAMTAGSILRITLFNYQGANPANVRIAVGSRFGSYCDCTASTNTYTLTNSADLVIDWTQCKVGVIGTANVYVTVENPGSGATSYTLRYNVIAAPTVQTLAPGTLGTFTATSWLANEGDFAVYKVTIPAASNGSPVYWDVSMDGPSWGTGAFVIYQSFGSNFGYQSKPPVSDVCNGGLTCTQTCTATECCTDSTKSTTMLYTVYRNGNGNQTFTLTAKILTKLNAYTQSANISSAQVGIPTGYSVSHINNIPTGSVAVLSVYNTNFTTTPDVFLVSSDTTPLIPVGTDASGCFSTGATEICNGVWTAAPNATCVTNYDCANPAYTVTYANKDANTNNAYSVLWNVYPPLSLTLGTSLTYNIIPALVGRNVQFVLDLTNAAFDAGNKYISVNVTGVNGPTALTVNYQANSPSCPGNSLCTFSAPNCEGTIDGCSRSTKYYIGIIANAVGSYVISTALITKPVTTLPSGLSSYTNRDVDSYFVYPYSTILASLDVYYSAMNPAVQTNNWGIGDYCNVPATTSIDGTRNRIYPCALNQATNKKVYFKSGGFAGQANYTYTVNPTPYTSTAMSVNTTYTGSLDKDTTYAFYNLTLPAMKPFDLVTVNFVGSCGAIHVLENWNAVAWPDQEVPITGGSGTCYRSAVASTNSASFQYAYCDWPNAKQERTIYFTVMGAERPYTNLVSFSAIATLTNAAPTLTQLPLRMDYLHNGTGNVVYWFETQTEAVGTQVYLNITVATADAPNSIAAVRNEWLEDSNCMSDDQLLYNELSTGAVPSWGDGGNTVCFNDGTHVTCTFMLYPAEYRDGRYYVYLNSNLYTKQVRLYTWVQRQGAVNVANDWSGYGTFGLPKQYQYYAIATTPTTRNYVTIKVWNVTNGAVSLLLPEYSSGMLTNKFYGGETLGSFQATDNNDAFSVGLNQFLVAPLGVCYFCTPYIYVAVRADTITQLGRANSTLGYSISFHFPAEMQIDNDTTVCAQTHFNANETTYTRNVTWEDIWMVKSWTYTGEQYFYWDTMATTQGLNFVFSGVGPASKNSPVRGADECGYKSTYVQETLNPAMNTASYTQECNYNQYHITVLDSENPVQSSYYLHPVVYQYPVQTYTLGTTISSTKCGSGLLAYYKVALTADNISYLSLTQSGSITRIDFQYGQVPKSGAWPAQPCDANVFAITGDEFCKVQTGTLYFTVVAFGDYSFTLSMVTPTPIGLTLNTPTHGSLVTGKKTIHTVTINPTPGQQLVVTLNKYWASQTARVTVTKDNMRGLCTSVYAADTSAATSATVTLAVCDTVAATYYVVVEPLASCTPAGVNEYTVTASLTTAIPEVTLTSGVAVTGTTSTTSNNNALYTFTPTAGNFIAVNFRTTDYNAAAATLTLQYSAGSAFGYSTESCSWYTATTLCTLDVRPEFANTHWCTAEIPACSFAVGKLYGFRVVSSDTNTHGFQLTVTQQSFSALSSTPVSATVTNAANYYSISTSTIQAIGLKVAVSSGQFEVRVWTYNCTYDCNQFERYFRCDANEGECRLEFANAVSHPRSLVYQVKIYGSGTYSATALTGTGNSLSAGSLSSSYFCYGTVNYTTWNYKSTADRDAEAQRLYNKWVGTGKWNCPTQACLKNLKFLACYYFFPQADTNGFLYDTCQTTCWTTTTTCGGNFTWAGFPEWDCYNHFYKPAPYCTGAFPGCDGVPGSGKTYDACGVCGGNGQSCATTSATGGPTGGQSTTTGGSSNTTLTTTGLSTTGTTTSGKNTTTTGTTTSKTTTTTTTTSKSTTTAGPTTTSTTGVNAAIASQPAFIFVMFAALVLLFLQA